MVWFYDETVQAHNGAYRSVTFEGPIQALRIYNESGANILEYGFADGEKSGELATTSDTDWMDMRGLTPKTIWIKGTAGQSYHVDTIPYGGMA